MILAISGRILLVGGRIVLILGILSFAALKIFFPLLDGSIAFWFLVSGFIGWAVSGILVPLMNYTWRILPKLSKKKPNYY